MGAVTVIGRDEVGVIAETIDTGVNGPYAMRYYLTACCGASATGTSYGVACRACYAPIPEEMGGIPSGPIPEPFGDGIPYETWKARLSA